MTRRQQQAAEARIRRLAAAIGPGPHAFDIRLAQHVISILKVLDDDDALAILEHERYRDQQVTGSLPLNPARSQPVTAERGAPD